MLTGAYGVVKDPRGGTQEILPVTLYGGSVEESTGRKSITVYIVPMWIHVDAQGVPQSVGVGR